MKSWLPFFALSVVLLGVLLLGSLSLLLLWVLSLVDVVCFFIAVSFLAVRLHPARPHIELTRLRPVQMADGLPWIPRTIQEILDTMDDRQFELFAAAVIVGLREGYRFERQCGGPGDQGVDVRLRTAYRLLVVVQCKEYLPGNPVGSPDLRDFSGAISLHGAIAGYFVTTSTFTSDAQQVIRQSAGRIRPIDGAQLEAYLQWRTREIALAYQEVQELSRGALHRPM